MVQNLQPLLTVLTQTGGQAQDVRQTNEYHLVSLADSDHLRVLLLDAPRPADVIWTEVLGYLDGHRFVDCVVAEGLTAPPLHDFVRAMEGTPRESQVVTVALDDKPESVPAGALVSVPVKSESALRSALTISADVYGTPLLDDTVIAAIVDAWSKDQRSVTKEDFLTYAGDRPATIGQVRLEGRTAFLSGAATDAGLRRRGGYSSNVGARLSWALSKGATEALVYTEDPDALSVLKRLGFTTHSAVTTVTVVV